MTRTRMIYWQLLSPKLLQSLVIIATLLSEFEMKIYLFLIHFIVFCIFHVYLITCRWPLQRIRILMENQEFLYFSTNKLNFDSANFYSHRFALEGGGRLLLLTRPQNVCSKHVCKYERQTHDLHWQSQTTTTKLVTQLHQWLLMWPTVTQTLQRSTK